MITDPKELERMVQFTRIAKASGFSPTQVDNALHDKGSSLQEVGAVLQYGADNIAKARTATQEAKKNAPSNTLLDNMLTKEALTAGVKGLGIGTERVLNGATLGAYDWANTKLGGTSRARAAQLVRDADEAGTGLGYAARGGILAADIGGGGISPITRAIGAGVGMATNGIGNNFVREVASGALGGGVFGGLRGGFESDFDPAATAKSAALGTVVGAAFPVVKEGVKLGVKGAKSAITAVRNGIAKTRFVGGMLSPSAEEMAAGAAEISGAVPDNGDLTGSAVKNLSDDVMQNVKQKTAAMYDKAEQLASGRKVLLDKNSNFAKAFNKIADNATRSGRSELNRVWNEVGHTKYDAPTYEATKSFRSWLSEKSATGGTGLSKKQYGDLLAALDKDIEASLGTKAAAAKKAADAAFRAEMSNPDSITNSVDKLLRKDPVSVVGNRAVASAQGKAWKASPLERVLKEGERIGSPYVADVKQGLQANTTTRAQFNRMSPAQKQMVYGDKLPLAEKNFNGGILNTVEKLANKGVDVISTPAQRILEALQPIAGQGAVTIMNALGRQVRNNELLRALQGDY